MGVLPEVDSVQNPSKYAARARDGSHTMAQLQNAFTNTTAIVVIEQRSNSKSVNSQHWGVVGCVFLGWGRGERGWLLTPLLSNVVGFASSWFTLSHLVPIAGLVLLHRCDREPYGFWPAVGCPPDTKGFTSWGQHRASIIRHLHSGGTAVVCST